jgi:hypothetical protein
MVVDVEIDVSIFRPRGCVRHISPRRSFFEENLKAHQYTQTTIHTFVSKQIEEEEEERENASFFCDDDDDWRFVVDDVEFLEVFSEKRCLQQEQREEDGDDDVFWKSPNNKEMESRIERHFVYRKEQQQQETQPAQFFYL